MGIDKKDSLDKNLFAEYSTVKNDPTARISPGEDIPKIKKVYLEVRKQPEPAEVRLDTKKINTREENSLKENTQKKTEVNEENKKKQKKTEVNEENKNKQKNTEVNEENK